MEIFQTPDDAARYRQIRQHAADLWRDSSTTPDKEITVVVVNIKKSELLAAAEMCAADSPLKTEAQILATRVDINLGDTVKYDIMFVVPLKMISVSGGFTVEQFNAFQAVGGLFMRRLRLVFPNSAEVRVCFDMYSTLFGVVGPSPVLSAPPAPVGNASQSSALVVASPTPARKFTAAARATAAPPGESRLRRLAGGMSRGVSALQQIARYLTGQDAVDTLLATMQTDGTLEEMDVAEESDAAETPRAQPIRRNSSKRNAAGIRKLDKLANDLDVELSPYIESKKRHT